jgi:hypothetical protein
MGDVETKILRGKILKVGGASGIRMAVIVEIQNVSSPSRLAQLGRFSPDSRQLKTVA